MQRVKLIFALRDSSIPTKALADEILMYVTDRKRIILYLCHRIGEGKMFRVKRHP